MSDAELKAAPSDDTSDVLPIDKGSKDRDDRRGKQSDNGGVHASEGSGGVRQAPEGGDQKHQNGGPDSLDKQMTDDLKACVEECRKFATQMQEKHGAAVLVLCETVFREGFHVASGMNLQTTLGLLDLTAFHIKNKLNQRNDIK